MIETKGTARAERRGNQRLQLEIPVHIQWRDSQGSCEEDSLTINVSTHGAYFMMEQEVAANQVLDVSMGVPNKYYGLLPSAMLRARGRVVRVEPLPEDQRVTTLRQGVAVNFESPPQLDFELPLS